MIKSSQQVLGFWLIGLFCVLGTLAAIQLLYASQIWNHADWVGALGTVGTLGGAIWIAATNERNRRNERIEMAAILAAEFSLRVAPVRAALEGVREVATSMMFVSDIRPICADAAGSLTSTDLWRSDELLPLAVVPDHAASRLAMCRTLVSWIGATLHHASSGQGLTLAEQFELSRILERHSLDAIEHIDRAQQACVAFGDHHGVGPTL